MKKISRFVGLDVHADTIAVAVAEADGEVRSLGVIPNRPECVQRLVKKKLGAPESLKVCYEAGPCGYELYWQMIALGAQCEVVAPTLIPVKAGDRVKTDRRDATKLARLYRAGELTAVWVPGPEHEAFRDLVRAREAAKKDQLRARHRLLKFLLRKGLRPPDGVRSWTLRHEQWFKGLRMPKAAEEAVRLDYVGEVDHSVFRIERLEKDLDAAIAAAPPRIRVVVDALQALRGIKRISAASIVAETGPLSRFKHPKQLMGYTGIASAENSSGPRTRRGGITKTGNAHLRRIVVEAAWSYRHCPNQSKELRKRQEGLAPEIIEIATKAQHRLYKRFHRLMARGKVKQQVVTAIGRELEGFIWDIGCRAEASLAQNTKSASRAAA